MNGEKPHYKAVSAEQYHTLVLSNVQSCRAKLLDSIQTSTRGEKASNLLKIAFEEDKKKEAKGEKGVMVEEFCSRFDVPVEFLRALQDVEDTEDKLRKETKRAHELLYRKTTSSMSVKVKRDIADVDAAYSRGGTTISMRK